MMPAPHVCAQAQNMLVLVYLLFSTIKGTVAHLTLSSGHCTAFSSTFPPLQVALSFACSVASLSLSPSFQLPGWHYLRGGTLADYLLGWGRASTCKAGHTKLWCTSIPKAPSGVQELLPLINIGCFLLLMIVLTTFVYLIDEC